MMKDAKKIKTHLESLKEIAFKMAEDYAGKIKISIDVNQKKKEVEITLSEYIFC